MEPIKVEIRDLLTALSVVGSIQLAVRHPLYTGITREAAERFARCLQAVIADSYPQLKELMENGWNPEYDCPIYEPSDEDDELIKAVFNADKKEK